MSSKGNCNHCTFGINQFSEDCDVLQNFTSQEEIKSCSRSERFPGEYLFHSLQETVIYYIEETVPSPSVCQQPRAVFVKHSVHTRLHTRMRSVCACVARRHNVWTASDNNMGHQQSCGVLLASKVQLETHTRCWGASFCGQTCRTCSSVLLCKSIHEYHSRQILFSCNHWSRSTQEKYLKYERYRLYFYKRQSYRWVIARYPRLLLANQLFRTTINCVTKAGSL